MCALYNFKYMIVIRTDNLPPVPGEGEGGEGGERDQQAQHHQEILQTYHPSVANTRRNVATPPRRSCSGCGDTCPHSPGSSPGGWRAPRPGTAGQTGGAPVEGRLDIV